MATSEATRPRKKSRKGYIPKSNALCVVVHSINGDPIPEKVSDDILNEVTQRALTHGLLINFTRT